MLRPTKHSHPDRTLISVSLLILQRLKVRRLEGFDALRAHVQKVAGSDALFVPSISFLYLMGLVEYRAKTDALEYVGAK